MCGRNRQCWQAASVLPVKLKGSPADGLGSVQVSLLGRQVRASVCQPTKGEGPVSVLQCSCFFCQSCISIKCLRRPISASVPLSPVGLPCHGRQGGLKVVTDHCRTKTCHILPAIFGVHARPAWPCRSVHIADGGPNHPSALEAITAAVSSSVPNSSIPDASHRPSSNLRKPSRHDVPCILKVEGPHHPSALEAFPAAAGVADVNHGKAPGAGIGGDQRWQAPQEPAVPVKGEAFRKVEWARESWCLLVVLYMSALSDWSPSFEASISALHCTISTLP